MTTLNKDQKQLLFDYCIGIASEREDSEARSLISSIEEAEQLVSALKSGLSPLASLSEPVCPDELVERTLLRLKNAARVSHLHLEQLLAKEQARTAEEKSSIWLNLARRLANAAIFMVVGGVLITTWNTVTMYARQKGQCQAQMAQIFRGVSSYKNDHEDKLPVAAALSGKPWWKVGYQGEEEHSATRPVWLLVRKGYVNSSDFICPGSRQEHLTQWSPVEVQQYNDFRGRKYITYSVRMTCNKSPQSRLDGPKPLMSDMNPLFENLPEFSRQLSIEVNRKLMTANSRNHMGRGQNVLFCDGSVIFNKDRRVGISSDDIFTLQNTRIYKGVEVPSCETDAFLAP